MLGSGPLSNRMVSPVTILVFHNFFMIVKKYQQIVYTNVNDPEGGTYDRIRIVTYMNRAAL